MSGRNILADTNIIMYILIGNEAAFIYKDDHFYVSDITEIELLGKKDISASEYRLRKDFLDNCVIVDLTEVIKKVTIKLKQKYRIKTADAIIASSAIYLNLPFVTADKGFKKIQELDLQLLDLK
jgi:predicted nucleic acid-binding protein